MALVKLILLLASIAVSLQEIYGHGRLTDPINRSSLWRIDGSGKFRPNYEDNQNYCGGVGVQYNRINRGKCGPCGDNYQARVPRANENGGTYGKGYVVKKYNKGEKVKVKISLDTNHLGYFEFSICKLANPNAVETEECFQQFPLKVEQDGNFVDRYYPGNRKGIMEMEVQLPQNLSCDRCVLRWHYRTGNSWGICSPEDKKVRGNNATEGNGCGNQEVFRSCSDISIN